MRLPPVSIQSWVEVKKLFSARFFEYNLEVTMLTLLTTQQHKNESVKDFIKRLGGVAFMCPSRMTQTTLIDMCQHNFQTELLQHMGIAECSIRKQLKQQGENNERLIVMI